MGNKGRYVIKRDLIFLSIQGTKQALTNSTYDDYLKILTVQQL